MYLQTSTRTTEWNHLYLFRDYRCLSQNNSQEIKIRHRRQILLPVWSIVGYCKYICICINLLAFYRTHFFRWPGIGTTQVVQDVLNLFRRRPSGRRKEDVYGKEYLYKLLSCSYIHVFQCAQIYCSMGLW